jgi:hypothetical protein
MNDKTQKMDLGAEFHEFLSVENTNPPQRVTAQVFALVHSDLNPSATSVFSKVAFIHLLVGAVTLLFCPQFGFSFTSSLGLMGVLMRYGEGVCMFGCGALFMGSSALMASLLLRPEEVKIIRKTEWIQFLILALLSASVFVCLGYPVLEAVTAIWLVGSVLGAITTLELGWRARSYLRRRLVYGL